MQQTADLERIKQEVSTVSSDYERSSIQFLGISLVDHTNADCFLLLGTSCSPSELAQSLLEQRGQQRQWS